MSERVASSDKRTHSPELAPDNPITSPTKTPRLSNECGEDLNCHECIERHLSTASFCPSCREAAQREDVFPNFALDSVIRAIGEAGATRKALQTRMAEQKRLADPLGDPTTQLALRRFLERTKEDKELAIKRLIEECDCISKDLALIPLGQAEAATNQVPSAIELPKDCVEDLKEGYLCLLDSKPSDRIRTIASHVQTLSSATQLRPIASISTGDLFSASSIVSSVELDRDDRLFATAGVSKRIKLYDLSSILEQSVECHYPTREIGSSTKVSCLSWNPYHQGQLAAADYDGIVSIYDVHTAQHAIRFEEHEKRAWSVDFSPVDPARLASGSDDCQAKIWSTRMPRSCITIDNRANICSVRFSPTNANVLAFGSAGKYHHVHLYDLRKAEEALAVLKEHKKAVSYVRFNGPDELVSASTDSTIKSWRISSAIPGVPVSGECMRTFAGHLNEKNFIGLANAGQLVACGSESNAVYVYSTHFGRPVASYHFNSQCPLTSEDVPTESSHFVSSVCWSKYRHGAGAMNRLLLAANSQGCLKVFELT